MRTSAVCNRAKHTTLTLHGPSPSSPTLKSTTRYVASYAVCASSRCHKLVGHRFGIEMSGLRLTHVEMRAADLAASRLTSCGEAKLARSAISVFNCPSIAANAAAVSVESYRCGTALRQSLYRQLPVVSHCSRTKHRTPYQGRHNSFPSRHEADATRVAQVLNKTHIT